MEKEKQMKIKEYNYGDGYFQKLFIKDGKIVDARCKCVWSQIHPNAFKEGDTLCKHIVASMKEYELEMWNKRKRLNKNGYVLIKEKNKLEYEHRIVVEKYIGRKLNKTEVVHHLDENKQNNKIENLMLFESNSEHQKFHTKIKQFGMTHPIKRQIKNRWKVL